MSITMSTNQMEKIINDVYRLSCFLTGSREAAENLTMITFDNCKDISYLFKKTVIWKFMANTYLCNSLESRRSNPIRENYYYKNVNIGSIINLSPEEKLTLMLKEIAGLNYQELAEILGYSKKNVSIVLAKARKKIIKKIKKQENIFV